MSEYTSVERNNPVNSVIQNSIEVEKMHAEDIKPTSMDDESSSSTSISVSCGGVVAALNVTDSSSPEPYTSNALEEDKENVAQNKQKKKSRKELSPEAAAVLKKWLLSPNHINHPYPNDEEKKELLLETGIDIKQLTNWFTNARKRIWKPLMREQHARRLQMLHPPQITQFTSNPESQPIDPFFHHRRGRPVRAVSDAIGSSTSLDDFVDAARIADRVNSKRPHGYTANKISVEAKKSRAVRGYAGNVERTLEEFLVFLKARRVPVPSEAEKFDLCRKTGMSVQFINNWLSNNRHRLHKPVEQRSVADSPPYNSFEVHNVSNGPASSASIDTFRRQYNAQSGSNAQFPSVPGYLRNPSGSSAGSRCQDSGSLFSPNDLASESPFFTSSALRGSRSQTVDIGSMQRRPTMSMQDIVEDLDSKVFVNRKFRLPSLETECAKLELEKKQDRSVFQTQQQHKQHVHSGNASLLPVLPQLRNVSGHVELLLQNSTL